MKPPLNHHFPEIFFHVPNHQADKLFWVTSSPRIGLDEPGHPKIYLLWAALIEICKDLTHLPKTLDGTPKIDVGEISSEWSHPKIRETEATEMGSHWDLEGDWPARFIVWQHEELTLSSEFQLMGTDPTEHHFSAEMNIFVKSNYLI